MPVLPEVDGISMRPAGEPAPADKPEWSDSTTTWGLRAVGPSGGPVDVYLGGGENQAGSFSRAFSQAREELATNRRRMAEKRRDRASETLTGTLKSLSPTRDSWKGAKYVVPESRAYTREFCVPSVDTHKVYMGFVEPVDLAKSMTQDGFNVRGVNLPLIGQPVETPEQGLAKQPRIEKLHRAEQQWQSVWGGGSRRRGSGLRSSVRASPGPSQEQETRAELDAFSRRLSGSPKRDTLPELNAASGGEPEMAGTWVAEVERKTTAPCRFSLKLATGRRGRLSGAGRQTLDGQAWVCKVSSGKVTATGLWLNLKFGQNDTEEWQGRLQTAEEAAAEAEADGGGGTVDTSRSCYIMRARKKGWVSAEFRLTRAS